MTWQQRAIGVVTLVVLTMVPAAATVCGVVCHGDHPVAAHCQEEAEPSGQFNLRAAPVHDCGDHQAIVGEVAIPAQPRMVAPVAALDYQPPSAVRYAHRTSPLTFASSAPPGSDPPTSTPSILRV